MSIRLALTVDNLRAHNPRGVARVARAIAEQFATDPRFDAYVIRHIMFDRIDVIADHARLSDYVAAVPLNLAERHSAPGKRGWKARLSDWVTHRLAWMLDPTILHAGAIMAKQLGLYAVARQIFRPFRRSLGYGYTDVAATQAEKALSWLGPTSLNCFQLVISFEAYENIWQWPVESLDCQTLLVTYDAIPLRIHEGPLSRPDAFFRSVALAVLRADRVVCASQSTMRDMHTFFPSSRGKTFAALLGHDQSRFIAVRDSSARPPQAHRHARRIVMVGSIDRRKNVQGVLRALPLLADRYQDAPLEFVIIGDHRNRRLFAHMERIAAKRVPVRWLGYLADDLLADFLRHSDVIVMPSLWEGFGLPVLEAMSASVPVVCSDLSSFPEVGGDYAFYCDPYDPASIADAIARALRLAGSARAQHLAAAADWAASFTWHRCADIVAEEMLRMVSGTAGPADRHDDKPDGAVPSCQG